MAYDERLAERIRRGLAGHPGTTEKAMFGGLCFMVNGSMCVGLIGDELMVRVGPDAHDAALEEPHVRPMDFTGRPMRGYIFVEPDGTTTPRALQRWLDRGVSFAATLPRRASKPRARATPKSGTRRTTGRG
jgi:TfoX/Sxy family transcriptional regulator of competence genes